ncbi:MAG: hypothetical protein ACLP7Q_26360 [Isosphaeraceae bacterium]
MLRECYDQDRRFGLRSLPAGLVAIAALLAGLPAWGQGQTQQASPQTSANKPPPDPDPAQAPPAPSPDFTLTPDKITIQYKTTREKGAIATDLVLAGVSPAEVSIKCTEHNAPKPGVWFKAVFSLNINGRKGDYTTGVVKSGDDGTCKIPMEEVAQSMLADLDGLLPPNFDPTSALSLGAPAKVGIKLVYPQTDSTDPVVAAAGQAAAKAGTDAADALKQGAANASDLIKTFITKAAVYETARVAAAKAAEPKTGEPVSVTNGNLPINLLPVLGPAQLVTPQATSDHAGGICTLVADVQTSHEPPGSAWLMWLPRFLMSWPGR